MIGKLAEKYIVCVINAIRASDGIAEVDNEKGGAAAPRTLRLVLGQLSRAGFFRPYGAGGFLKHRCPRAYALGYLLPSLREGFGGCGVRAIPRSPNARDRGHPAAFFLPETKGKTLEEIEAHFEGSRSPG